jgi:hypothetical protein
VAQTAVAVRRFAASRASADANHRARLQDQVEGCVARPRRRLAEAAV